MEVKEKEEHFLSLAGATAFDVYMLYSLLYVENKMVIIGIIFISQNNLLLSET